MQLSTKPINPSGFKKEIKLPEIQRIGKQQKTKHVQTLSPGKQKLKQLIVSPRPLPIKALDSNSYFYNVPQGHTIPIQMQKNNSQKFIKSNLTEQITPQTRSVPNIFNTQQSSFQGRAGKNLVKTLIAIEKNFPTKIDQITQQQKQAQYTIPKQIKDTGQNVLYQSLVQPYQQECQPQKNEQEYFLSNFQTERQQQLMKKQSIQKSSSIILKQKASIQPQQQKVPQIVVHPSPSQNNPNHDMQFQQEKTKYDFDKRESKRTSNQLMPLQGGSLIRNSILTVSDQSMEDYNIWDNQELQVRGVNLEELSKIGKTERMLKLYKIRFGQFPLQREPISNDSVIKSVKKIAATNSKVYRQYFANNKPNVFNDPEDYSQKITIEAHQLQKYPKQQ